MSQVRTILSYGKYMKVVGADTTRPARKLSGKRNDFAMVPLGWAADVTEAMNTPGYMVFTLLATWPGSPKAQLSSCRMIASNGTASIETPSVEPWRGWRRPASSESNVMAVTHQR